MEKRAMQCQYIPVCASTPTVLVKLNKTNCHDAAICQDNPENAKKLQGHIA